MLVEHYDEVVLRAEVEALTGFCIDADVMSSANIRQVLVAHLRRGLGKANVMLQRPLRRGGFTESERVAAYLRSLEGGVRRRIGLSDELWPAGGA